MGKEFLKLDYDLVSGGTDTHVLLIDLTNKSINGKKAEKYFRESRYTSQ